jgi:hypothetical protein
MRYVYLDSTDRPAALTWYATLEVMRVGWKTWVFIVPLSVATSMAISLGGARWYYALGAGLTSALIIVLSVVVWQLSRCPTDAKVDERHIVLKKDSC